jgi:hypothetical protein
MDFIRKLCARFGPNDWVLLTEMPGNRWSFQIWGPHPVQGKIDAKSENEAKNLAFEIVKAHLAALGRLNARPHLSVLPWQVAVRWS